jgi:hypothetical protein
MRWADDAHPKVDKVRVIVWGFAGNLDRGGAHHR